MEKQSYSTPRDYVNYTLVDALGEFFGDYDIDAICDEVLEPVSDGLKYYFVEKDLAESEFWNIVAKHDIANREEKCHELA